jgi:hypothetical protein
MMPPKKRFSYAFSSISLIAYSWVYEKVKKKTSFIEALRRAKIGGHDGPWAISGECPEQSERLLPPAQGRKNPFCGPAEIER